MVTIRDSLPPLPTSIDQFLTSPFSLPLRNPVQTYLVLTGLGILSSPIEQVMNSFSQTMSRENFLEASKVLREETSQLAINFAAITTTATVAQVGLHIIGSYVQAYLVYIMGKPKLAMEYDFHTWKGAAYNVMMAPYNCAKSIFFANPPPTRPVFKSEIETQLSAIAKATANIQRNDGYFSNLLLYGPPGTGKTMVSKLLAKEAGMNYVMMSGGDMAQYIKRGEHVSELNTLFRNVAASSGPTIIFIDEAEGLTRNRDKLDMERLELLNAFLNLTGEPSKKFMLILATNRPEDLDAAVISRMDNRIHISPPEKEERLQILTLYLNQFFDKGAAIFDQAFLNKINDQIEGFTGRDIFKLCNGFAIAKASQVNNKLTEQLVTEVIAKVTENRNEMDRRIQAARG